MTTLSTPDRTLAVVNQTASLSWIQDPARVEKLSKDFFWFSPVLKEALGDKVADAVVRPTTEDEIRAVVSACAINQVPITVRGSGTGNYGQCTPLHGGVILDLSGYNQFLWSKAGLARAQSGIRMSVFNQACEPTGYEMRCVPSTFRSATIGGLYGGGFGGIGSINSGPLVSTGNVLGIKAMSVEANPQVFEMRAPEALTLHHVYGTNGIVLEMELGLSRIEPWVESIVTFETFDQAIEFCDAVASAPGIVKRSVTFLAAPIPELLQGLAAYFTSGCHAALIYAAEYSQPAIDQLTQEFKGTKTYSKAATEVGNSGKTILEYTWNHTTLHALKVDKTLTYIQSGFSPGIHVQQAKKLNEMLKEDVLMHLEFIRTKEGLMNCSGLQIIRYTTTERLNKIMQTYRDNGAYIANPHVFIVEDGKQGTINPAVVAMKARLDPQGLLNPGKLRGWELRSEKNT